MNFNSSGKLISSPSGALHNQVEQIFAEDTLNDPEYKKFSAAVDKSLQVFDNVTEWADIISFLSRIAKLLQSNSNHGVIPKKHILAKRLAQCLNPALPTGVHQKVLEAYGLIFHSSKKSQLAEDLPLWTTGLFPFANYAAMSVRGALLTLYEKYLIPLGPGLRPVLKPCLLGILPLLEEEGNEFFLQAARVLQSLCKEVEPIHFYQALWLAIVTSPKSRLSAVNYLTRYMPSIETPEDVAVTLGKERRLFARALCSLLEDKLPLVRRGGLELLANHVHLHGFIFGRKDTEDIVGSAITVLLSRDMSLNRRLYSWLLKSSEQFDSTIELISLTLSSMIFAETKDGAELTKPFRILIALLDKPEIGQRVFSSVFVTLLQGLKSLYERDHALAEEVLHSATRLFEMVDQFMIWKKFLSLFDDRSEVLLIDFVLEKFALSDDESQRIHLPFFYQCLVAKADEWIQKLSDPDLEMEQDHIQDQIHHLLNLAHQTALKISPNVFVNTWSLKDFRGLSNETRRRSSASRMRTPSMSALTSSPLSPPMSSHVSNLSEAISALEELTGPSVENLYELYDTMCDSSKDEERKRMIRTYLVGRPSLSESAAQIQKLMIHAINFNSQSLRWNTFWLLVWSCLCDIISVHSKNGLVLEGRQHKEWMSAIMKWCSLADTPIYVIKVTFNCLEPHFLDREFVTRLGLRKQEINAFASAIVVRAWSRLDNDHISSHVDAVDMLSKLEHISQTSFLEHVILNHIVSNASEEEKSLQYQRLGVFWRLREDVDSRTSLQYSRLLFLIFDDLNSADWENRIAAEIWIRSYVKYYIRLIHPLLAILCHSRISFRMQEAVATSLETTNAVTVKKPMFITSFNMAQTQYGLNVLTRLLGLGEDLFRDTIWEQKISEPWLLSRCSWISGFVEGESVPLESLKMAEGIALIVLQIAISEQNAIYADMNPQKLSSVQSSAFQLLGTLLQDPRCLRSPIVKIIFEAMLNSLAFSVDTGLGADEGRQLLHNDLILLFQKVCGLMYQCEPHFVDQDKRVTGLLIPVLLKGLSDQINKKNFHTWLDLILFHVPVLSNKFNEFAQPLLNMITREVGQYRSLLQELHTATLLKSPGSKDCLALVVPDDSSDVDILALFYSAERILKSSLSFDPERSSSDSLTGNTIGSSVPILSQVFRASATEPSNKSDGVGSNHEDVFLSLPDIVFEVVMLLKFFANQGVEPNPFRHLLDRFRTRGKRLFDMLYSVAPKSTLECFVLVWHQELSVTGGSSLSASGSAATQQSTATMDALELLTIFSSRVLFNQLIEILRSKIPTQASSPSGGPPELDALSINVFSVLSFMEHFLERSRLSNEDIVGIWHTMYPCLREACQHAASVKYLFPSLLRLQVTLVMKYQAIPEKRIRKEMDDMFQRICDYCILLAGRAFEQGPWRRTEAYDIPRSGSITSLDSTSTRNLSNLAGGIDSPLRRDRKLRLSDDAIVRDMMVYMADKVIPAFKKQTLLSEPDRILAIVSNIMTYIVSPSLKTRSSTNKMLAVPLLELLASLGSLTQAARVWKKDVWEAFMDAKFFHVGSKSLALWKKIVLATIHLDKDRIDDILARCMPLGSSSIFTSKEQEVLIRAQMIKKLSFVIFAAPTDHFHPQLPAIQEKIVEIFKTPNDILFAETYFLIRVLILRISSKHLSNFWPILINELFRNFGQVLREEKEFIKNIEKPVFSAACRLLDYLVVLSFPEYQYYQSMFLPEPEVFTSRAGWKKSKSIVERFDRICDNFNVSSPEKLYFAALMSPTQFHQVYQRKPFVPKVNTPQLLKDFIVHLNDLVQISAWTASDIDYTSVESLLESEFLDGGSAAAMFAPPQLSTTSPAAAELANLSVPSKPKLMASRSSRSRKGSASSNASVSSSHSMSSSAAGTPASTPPRSRKSASTTPLK